MRRKRTSPARRLGLVAVAVALAAALGAAGARLTRRRHVSDGPPASHPTGSSQEESYTCKCGQEYRVTGVDRHRVYFLEGKDEPVLGNTCVNCDAPLPAGHDAAVV
jgi:hypothetical protein